MDKEKVIKDIKECLSASCRGFRPRELCPYNDDEWDIMRDALAVLEEQPEIVRCKDCRYRYITEGLSGKENKLYPCMFTAYPDDWFCADGKHK